MAATAPAHAPVSRLAPLRPLLEGCVENLLETWDGERALFPFSSRLEDGRVRNDYDQPWAVRYTITSLLGLVEAARAGVGGFSEDDADALVGAFLRRRGERVEGAADHALLTLLLCTAGAEEAAVRRSLSRLSTALAVPDRRLHVQDLSWAIWGATAAAERGVGTAAELARATLERVRTAYLEPRTGLPRHSTRAYRRSIVSFGSLVYFLRAMHESARVLGDSGAAALFAGGVRRALALQGPRGEWPWLIHVGTGATIDAYPVFAVHQDSMSMLFLLPALDAGHEGVAPAIERSLAWIDGDNELGVPMYVDRPFHFAYRSIERSERLPRARRYLRSLAPGTAGADFGVANVWLNDECRSYHPGWVLYAWSPRVEEPLTR